MAGTRQTSHRFGSPPDPAEVETLDDLAVGLRRLRAWSGLSFRELHRRLAALRRSRGVVEIPTLTTIHRSMQPGRRRLDLELVTDIAAVLLGEADSAGPWRAACQRVMSVVTDASVVAVVDRFPERDELAGREAELADLLGPHSSVRPGAPVIVEGMAGIGKTALAAHVARALADRHRIAIRLTVDLRGSDSGRAPVEPAAMVAAVLHRLGIGGHRTHGLSLEAQTARLRHLTAGQGAVILLDDVADIDQIRPLVAGDAPYFLLATTRRRMDVPGSIRVALAELDEAAALDYFARLIGESRMAAEPDAAAAAVKLVGRLPLAIGLLGARIAAYPDWSVADHVDRLRDRHDKLQVESGIDVALTTTYAALSAELQRAIRLVGLHPGRRLDAYVTAALLDTDLATAHDRLDELAAHHLVQPTDPDGFELHDLVQVFAANQAHDQEAPTSRHSALTRLLDMYCAASAAAARCRVPASGGPAHAAGTPVPRFAGREDSASWLETHHVDLAAAADYAADNGWADQLSILSAALADYLVDTARYREAASLHRKAVQHGNPAERARAYLNLGTVYLRIARYEDADEVLDRALTGARVADDRELECRTLVLLGWVAIHLHDNETALRRAENALALADEAGVTTDLARALSLRGAAQTELGALADAAESVEAAIAAVPRGADPTMLHTCEGNLAWIRCLQGDYPAALRMLEPLLAEHRRSGEKTHAALVLNILGEVYARLGDDRQAVGSHRRAIVLAAEIGYSDCETEACNDLAGLMRSLGHPNIARGLHQRALGVAGALDIRYERARAYEGMAEIAFDAGDRSAAVAGWKRSLEDYRELGVPEADRLAQRLRDLGATADASTPPDGDRPDR
jgi:tetratricopeptide (TPR) repeat protein